MAVQGRVEVVCSEPCEDVGEDNDRPWDHLTRGAELSSRTSAASFGSSLDGNEEASFLGACDLEA